MVFKVPDQHCEKEPTHWLTSHRLQYYSLKPFSFFPFLISMLYFITLTVKASNQQWFQFTHVPISRNQVASPTAELVVSAERRRFRLSGGDRQGRRLSSQPAQRGLAAGHLITRTPGGGARRSSDAHQRLHHWAGHQLGPVRCVPTDAASSPTLMLASIGTAWPQWTGLVI